MDNLLIRVYVVELPEKKQEYQCRAEGDIKVTRTDTLEMMVSEVWDRIQYFQRNSRSVCEHDISIDFKPPHDIEYWGIAPKLCVSLSDQDKAEFWKLFSNG